MKRKLCVILIILITVFGFGWGIVNVSLIEETENAGIPIVNVESSVEKTEMSDKIETKDLTENFYCIPDSSLVIESLKNYAGAYVEDGTGEAVTGVASIVVKNTGNLDVEYAQINLYSEEQTLFFELAGLPSGEKVLVLEKNKQSADGITTYTADVLAAEVELFEKSEEEILVQEIVENSLTIQNISDSDLETVRLFYKNYNEDEAMYMGGIAYTAKITDLKQGAGLTIYPSHYRSGESEVIMVRIYNESKE